jgi:nicotinamide mononucleotide transporter
VSSKQLFEIVAAALGIISVFLSTRQNVLAWPTSLLNNAMYGAIFLQQRLYALMVLQGCFFAIALYGWYQWLFGGTAKTELKVSRIPPKLGGLLALIAAAETLLIWLLLSHHTEDPAPFIDALFFAVSLVAQWMMARKYFECWPVWVAINCVAVPFFFLHRSYPTMAQYAVFLVLAIMGWRHWKASLETREPGAAGSG